MVPTLPIGSPRRQPENQPQPSDVIATTRATMTVRALCCSADTCSERNEDLSRRIGGSIQGRIALEQVFGDVPRDSEGHVAAKGAADAIARGGHRARR